MLQLHARIRENELRAQQVLHSQRWFEDPQILTMKVILPEPPEIQCGWNLETLVVVTLFFFFAQQKSVKEGPSDRLRCDEDLSRKLAVSELEVLHLNELYKQATHKYTEDLRKLEEKVAGQPFSFVFYSFATCVLLRCLTVFFLVFFF